MQVACVRQTLSSALYLDILVVERDEAVVLDLEAGVEHIGRGTARQVDALLIVADSNLKSLGNRQTYP